MLGNVSEKIKMNSLVAGIRGMFAETEELSRQPARREDVLREINVFLGLLGMLGEKGTSDILSVCQYLIEHDEGVQQRGADPCRGGETGDVQNLEQRMRRAIKKGLTNVANLGIDDYSNEVFQVYANYVFDFKNIKDEMDFIKGSSSGGGRVNISKFIEGLLLYRKSLL